MVLEAIIPSKVAERKPVEMLPLSFLYASIGILLALWIFPSHASLAMVFFTVMAVLPLMINVFKLEKRKEEEAAEGDVFVHRKSIPFFVYMFLGMILAYSIWAISLPYLASSNLFKLQIDVIEQINANVVGAFTLNTFSAIVTNNLRVLVFSLLFSFIYGAGAIFILTWNASVISVAIAEATRKFVSSQAAALGAQNVAFYFQGFGLALLRYMIHGIPEIMGYFVGGLAGGIISIAVLKHEFGSKPFRKAMLDALYLTLLAVLILFISAVVEVWVSPIVPISL